MWDSGLTAHLLNVAAEIGLVLLTASTSVGRACVPLKSRPKSCATNASWHDLCHALCSLEEPVLFGCVLSPLDDLGRGEKKLNVVCVNSPSLSPLTVYRR